MKLAYILNTYPQPSHSFIRREVQALERGGAQVCRIAMRSSAEELVESGDCAEAEKTTYVLKAGGLHLLGDLLGAALGQPRRFASALRMALALGRASEAGMFRHLIYLAEAAHVKRICATQGAQHMHAHFGTNAAAVAMLTHALGGPGYSFTTHGPEEFDAPRALSLRAKLDSAAFAVGVSRFGVSQLRRWASFDTWDRIEVVHCGVEPAAFAEPVALPDGALKLVSIGRFVEQKGQMVLIEAMAHLREQLPGLHLSLVGDGEMRAELERAIARHGLQDNVTLTGWLDEAAVRHRLNAAHALVMPSFAEGLPMVVMEAMAAARPVIATYIAGIPELVQPGRTGWLVPAGDPGALADAVTELARTPEPDRVAMGMAGRERVLQRHDADREAARLAELFGQAITRAG